VAEARAFRVRGRVQGVGFRWWTQRAASRLGLRGMVWNDGDGSVVVEAWGKSASLSELERLLASGPPGARVDALERLAPPAGADPGDFTIAR
jgi:acylphosphatase